MEARFGEERSREFLVGVNSEATNAILGSGLSADCGPGFQRVPPSRSLQLQL